MDHADIPGQQFEIQAALAETFEPDLGRWVLEHVVVLPRHFEQQLFDFPDGQKNRRVEILIQDSDSLATSDDSQ